MVQLITECFNLGTLLPNSPGLQMPVISHRSSEKTLLQQSHHQQSLANENEIVYAKANIIAGYHCRNLVIPYQNVTQYLIVGRHP